MKKQFFIFLILLSSIYIYACDGDCIKCHPVLVKTGKLDKNHKILTTCKTCHKITSESLARMGSKCGEDCWECHDIKKVEKIKIKEHAVLGNCIKCHKTLDHSSPFGKKQNLDFLQKSFSEKIK